MVADGFLVYWIVFQENVLDLEYIGRGDLSVMGL